MEVDSEGGGAAGEGERALLRRVEVDEDMGGLRRSLGRGC